MVLGLKHAKNVKNNLVTCPSFFFFLVVVVVFSSVLMNNVGLIFVHPKLDFVINSYIIV
jgi:hypothetical protein